MKTRLKQTSKHLSIALAIFGLWFMLSGCLQTPSNPQDALTRLQKTTIKSPNARLTSDSNSLDSTLQETPLDILRNSQANQPDDKNFLSIDSNEVLPLTLSQAVISALANNQTIRSASIDPEMTEQDITQSLSEFDPTAYGEINYDARDEPAASTSDITQSDTRNFETGIKQKSTSGTEWSARYLVTRTWDDYYARPTNLETRWQPVLAFQLKKPLWREGDRETVMAGIDIAKLNHRIALLGFQKTAEQIATEAIYAYWQLYQARHELDIQRELFNMAQATLDKVEGRRDIDATDIQIQQSLSSLKSRQALILQAEKRVRDVQDQLIRLLALPQTDLLRDLVIKPSTPPHQRMSELDHQGLLSRALQRHPSLMEAQLKMDIADLNIKIAQNQRMPRLDFILSASTTSLADTSDDAHDHLFDGKYVSHAVGLSMEYPLGNRARNAELKKRRIQRLKAQVELHDIADEIAVQVKEAIRGVQTQYLEIDIQRQAMEASKSHLAALEESENIRERLTPEFMFVKLQAQETLANNQRAYVEAITSFNLSLARLSHVTGSVLNLQKVDDPRGS